MTGTRREDYREEIERLQARVAELEAEWDEPTIEQIEARWAKKFADAKRNIENKAIERCAQVADAYGGALRKGSLAAQTIAADIRALKDACHADYHCALKDKPHEPA